MRAVRKSQKWWCGSQIGKSGSRVGSWVSASQSFPPYGMTILPYPSPRPPRSARSASCLLPRGRTHGRLVRRRLLEHLDPVGLELREHSRIVVDAERDVLDAVVLLVVPLLISVVMLSYSPCKSTCRPGQGSPA